MQMCVHMYLHVCVYKTCERALSSSLPIITANTYCTLTMCQVLYKVPELFQQSQSY